MNEGLHNTKYGGQYGRLEESLSIDENMISYYGKHYAKQFIRGKPIRFRFRNWAICSSSGYTLNFGIYMERKKQQEKVFGIGGDTVIFLLEKAQITPNQGFKIFFDNCFTSVKLMKYLSDKEFCATGTIQDGTTKNCLMSDKKIMEK
ncbi:hypothetical protein ILUMI_17657 [Ignelater luminosus]|uniref:PiggyBac transposable element-derived protein domain-containing protein n=1 Tax=Ignelater luminosus TaxID=2038154 RepID=A0A8K0CMW2_IGNLU|nr:hypothetical protein ILUMI_17657 [Ignelater luminosus]